MDGSSGHIVPLKVTENISKFRDSLLFSFETMDLKKNVNFCCLSAFRQRVAVLNPAWARNILYKAGIIISMSSVN